MARKSRKHQNPEAAFSPRATLLPAWIYARISNVNEFTEPSIDNQIEICKNYINTNNDLTFGGVFTDSGYSGTNFERPGYTDMIAGVLSGKVKCIVVKDLSRLGRTYIEVGELLFDTFVQNGIRFISVNEDYDTDTDDVNRKKLFILIKNLINHMYSLDLGKKIRATIELKKHRGEPLGLPPYGYCRSEDKKRFEIDCEAAEIVKLIFDKRNHGDSTYSIARHLNEHKILTPQQYHNKLIRNVSKPAKWSDNTVSRILHNATYTGSLVQEMVTRDDAHPAIISKDQFDTVAQLMQESAIKYKKKQDSPADTRYSGKIFCTRCGRPAVRCENRKTNGVIFYYGCRHCINELKDDSKLRTTSNLPVSNLDIIVTEALRQCMEMLKQLERKIEALSESDLLRRKGLILTRARTELEKNISNYEKILLGAYTHHLSGLLDIRDYRLARDKIEKDRTEAETQLTRIMDEQKKYDIKNIRNNQWLIKFGEFRNCKTPTKEAIQALIRCIYLTPLTNEITIDLNFMDSFEELREIMQEIGLGH